MLRLATPFTTFSTLPILATILVTTQITSRVHALSRSDIPSACYDQCDGSISMLNSCGLETSGSNMNTDNSACFCQNMSKSNYKDCATCIRNNQDGYTDTGYTNTDYNTYTTTDYNDDNQFDNNDYNTDYNNNNDNNNNNDYNNDDYDDSSDYRKRAVPFGKPTPAPRKQRHLQSKRGVLDDLLNLDGLVCTVNGVVSDAGSVVGDVTSLALSLVTEVLDGRTTTYTRGNRDDDADARPTTVYATVTSQRNSASNKMSGRSVLVAVSLVAIAFAI